MNFKLILLRHGNTFQAHETAYQVGCKTDLSLTEKGLSQATAFVSHLQGEGITPFAIYSGSLQRQSQTAQIIQKAFPQAQLLTHQAALDEIDYGEWEGLTVDAIRAKWPKEYQAWQEQAIWPHPLFGGNLSYHLDSLQNWLLNLQQTAPENSFIIAVSSNGIIRLMLHFLPTLWNELVSNHAMEKYKVGTGHYCELWFNQLKPTIQSWNKKP